MLLGPIRLVVVVGVTHDVDLLLAGGNEAMSRSPDISDDSRFADHETTAVS
jgi:hypothetical protein